MGQNDKKRTQSDTGGKCLAHRCSKDDSHLGFCQEHYEHFKFGLIKKNGLPVPDYEKKWDQFQLHQKRKTA